MNAAQSAEARSRMAGMLSALIAPMKDLRLTAAMSGRPSSAKCAVACTSARLCMTFLPKPIPTSRQMRPGSTPSVVNRVTMRIISCSTSWTTSS